MRILALNSGSSSIKCALFDMPGKQRLLDLRIEQIGTDACRIVRGEEARHPGRLTYEGAAAALLDEVKKAGHHPIAAVVHRVVHGGPFTEPVLVDAQVLARIDELGFRAPLHNPPALAVLRAAQAVFAAVPQVAVFDTAFHRTLPPRAREYALPGEVRDAHNLQRAGFHGISHAHVMQAAAAHLHAAPEQLRIVSCHLGNGASAAAIEYGRSVETSMGFTPLEGLVMGTRGGDLDPGIVVHLLRAGGFDAAGLDRLLNSRSGLLGLAGTFDFAEIEQRAAAGDEDCRRAIAIYAHRVRKYIGAYAAAMGGVDVIVFTGGVGEHSALLRHRVSQRLDFLGAVLDEDRNRDAGVSRLQPVASIAAEESRVRMLVIAADEELQMAIEAQTLLSAAPPRGQRPRIPVAISARHAHLSAPTVERLFGAGYELRKRCDLSQRGQYALEETVSLIGPRGRIDQVRLLGPLREDDQVEISRTDEFVLGVDAPVRLSGDLGNTPGITLEGPRGRVTIPHGVICARRHIHMAPADARQFGVRHGEMVQVAVDSDGRALTFADVMVRVGADYTLEFHLDTDEANAAGVRTGQLVEIVDGKAP